MDDPRDAAITMLRNELMLWQSLKDPMTLHRNLLAGFPARLNSGLYMHLAGQHIWDNHTSVRALLAHIRAVYATVLSETDLNSIDSLLEE